MPRRHTYEELNPEQAAFYNASLWMPAIQIVPDHNDPDSTGVGTLALNNPDGIRWSTTIGYLNPARHRLNLTINANCLVHRLLFEGKRAVGVQVESGGEMFDVYSEEIVLSGGSIGSPHILMLSGYRTR